MGVKLTKTTLAAAAAMICVLLLFMVVLGGLVLVLSLAGAAVTLMALPLLWLTGRRRRAVQLLTAWGIYLAIYLTIATGITWTGREPDFSIGEEVCADSGCFAVESVDRADTFYTLHWHLSSNDRQMEKHFPGKGLELYLFDERGRKFVDTAHPNPLDVTLPPGEMVRQAMTFRVPADARQLFLTAKYRPFTFQSLLPGELSVVPRRPGKLIRIQ